MTFDRVTRVRRLPRAAKSALMATAAALAIGNAAALAQNQGSGPGAPLKFRNSYFGYGLAVGPRVTYTDNISLAPDGLRDGEFAAGVSTDASAIYSNNRFTGIFDGTLDVSYLTDQSEIVASQDIGAVGTATIADNLFYVDLGASSSRQLAGEDARFSHNVNAGRNQRVNVHDFAVSPYLNRRFGDGSAVELRYRFAQAFIESNSTNLNRTIFDRNSRTQEVVATYDSGRALDRLNVALTAYGNRTRDYGAQLLQDYEYERGTLQGDFQFGLSDRFALAGSIGYDEVDTSAPTNFISEDELSGVFWDAGFRLTPGRKTDILLKYGRRYGNDSINGYIRYDVTERIHFAANASRTFQTRALASATQYQAMQRRTLDFVENLRAGGSGDASGIVDALTRVARQRFGVQQIGLGVADNVNASLAGVFGRTTLTMAGHYRDVDYGFRQIETIGVTGGIRRAMSRRMTAYSNVFYRRADSTADLTACLADPTQFFLDPTAPGFDAAASCGAVAGFQGTNTTVGGRIGISYRVYQNVSAFGEYAHTERFSQNPGLEYGENTVTAGLQLEF
ncbi:MAG: hypothetical protein R3C42_05270 [Parvularculaceae bacterium]|nr:hypothetical protein [Parvularculaceae bacterium]